MTRTPTPTHPPAPGRWRDRSKLVAIIIALLILLAAVPVALFWMLVEDDSYEDRGRDRYAATADYRFDSDLELPAPRWLVDETVWTRTSETNPPSDAEFTAMTNSCTLLAWQTRIDNRRPDLLAITDRAATISAFRTTVGIPAHDETALEDDVVGFGYPDSPYQADVLAWTDPEPEPEQHRRILARASLNTHQIIGFTVVCDTAADYDTAVGAANDTLRITG